MDDKPVVSSGAGDDGQAPVAAQDVPGESGNASGAFSLR